MQSLESISTIILSSVTLENNARLRELRKLETGCKPRWASVVELCRQAGISEQTFYRWRKQYVGLEIDQVRQLNQLQEERKTEKAGGRAE